MVESRNQDYWAFHPRNIWKLLLLVDLEVSSNIRTKASGVVAESTYGMGPLSLNLGYGQQVCHLDVRIFSQDDPASI
jgi:hypothetical protein